MRSSVGLCAVVALMLAGSVVVSATPLLGAKQCTWGPSFWCSNITNAKSCNAVTHCIQTVWEMHDVPVDDDSICQICKDMVKQARDQLQSNETMEELKEVFEGSCNLIPLKIVKKECCRLADDFIPELVEALSSQMNPDQVCSVAGLCNNAEIDKLLMDYYSAALSGTLTEEEESKEVATPKQQQPSAATPKVHLLTCGNCNHLATLMTNKFTSSNRDEVLENLLHLCGEMSSFSDACSNIVLTYFNDIYDHLKANLEPSGICHLSGSCASKYHQHPEDPKEEEDTEALAAVVGDDLTCKLCEQLVTHLRDLLVANTTEAEFKQVLEGLCKQTKEFSAECLSIVDQYYDVIYNQLVHNLDPNSACFLAGICPKGNSGYSQGEIRPLLPTFPPAEIKVTIRKKLGANEPKFTQEEIHQMALPIDKLMGAANPGLLVENGELCTLCEYLLHFVQETLATQSTEEDIKRAVNGVCDKMPHTLRGECHNFIDMYGDAVIALLIQGLNPRDCCPKMQLCPKNHNFDDVEIFDPLPDKKPNPAIDESDKPTCPLCLFAVEQAQEKIKNDKSKANIKKVLDHLCVRLPTKLQGECMDFVETYSNELIDMLITDFKPQEICVTLKLCPKTNTDLEDFGISVEDESNDEIFNEIDGSSESVEIAIARPEPPNCLLCVEFIKIAEKKIGKNHSKEEIEKALQHSCDKLRKHVQEKCHKYVDRYGDKIADLIIKEMAPKMICRELGLCLWSEQEDLEIDEALKYDVVVMPNSELRSNDRFTGPDDIVPQEPPTCVLCEFVMVKLEAELKNKTEQEEIKKTIEKICSHMPKTVTKTCDKFIEQYADAILKLISDVPPKEICQRLQLCFAGLEIVGDEVIECGVCHGVSSTLLPYFRQHLDAENIKTGMMVTVACESVPAKYYQICSDMVSIYGKSIMHLSQKNYIDEAHVCAEIGKCYDNEKSSFAFARISA